MHNWAGGHTDLTVFPEPFKLYGGTSLPGPMQKDFCTLESTCAMITALGGGYFRSRIVNTAYDVYLAYNTSVIKNAVCTIETGGLYQPNQG